MIPELEIRKRTAALRESDEARWRRLRALFAGKGIDPAGAAMAYLAEEDPCCEFGVVVTAFGFITTVLLHTSRVVTT